MLRLNKTKTLQLLAINKTGKGKGFCCLGGGLFLRNMSISQTLMSVSPRFLGNLFSS